MVGGSSAAAGGGGEQRLLQCLQHPCPHPLRPASPERVSHALPQHGLLCPLVCPAQQLAACQSPCQGSIGGASHQDCLCLCGGTAGRQQRQGALHCSCRQGIWQQALQHAQGALALRHKALRKERVV